MVMQPGGGQPGAGVGPTGASSGRFVVVLRFPTGESIQVLVTAPSRQAAEAAAIKNFGTQNGVPMAGVSAQGADAQQFPPDYLRRIGQQIDASGGAPITGGPTVGGPGGGPTGPQFDPNTGIQSNIGAGGMAQTRNAPGGLTDTSGRPIYMPETSEEGRYGSFQRALQGTGRNIAGVFGEKFRDQFDPYQQAFNARTALGQFPAEGAPEDAFGQFVSGNQNPYRSALDSLRQLYASRQQGPTTAPVASYLTPNTQQDFSGARGLFDAALQGRVGGAAAEFLRRFIPQAQGQFYAGNNPDFLGELQRRLGLGNALF